MMMTGFYCPYCGNKQKQCAPIDLCDDGVLVSFACENCNTPIAFSI